jgi:glutaredoxin
VIVSTTVTLLSKPGCHLCDEARQTVLDVLADLDGTDFVERSILDDDDLFQKYVEEIPVVLINDRVHNIWRVDADRLRTAILEVTA